MKPNETFKSFMEIRVRKLQTPILPVFWLMKLFLRGYPLFPQNPQNAKILFRQKHKNT